MIFLIDVESLIMPQKIVKPNEKFGSPSDLLKWSKECKDVRQSERFTAIRLLMLGRSREDVMEVYDISWSTLQRWVKLWNKGGKESLMMGKPTGRPSRLTQEGKNFLIEQIEFTNKRTGKKVNAIHISGILEKKYRDQIKARCDSLSSSQDGLRANCAPDDAYSEGREKS